MVGGPERGGGARFLGRSSMVCGVLQHSHSDLKEASDEGV